jgi:hypothetical protein
LGGVGIAGLVGFIAGVIGDLIHSPAKAKLATHLSCCRVSPVLEVGQVGRRTMVASRIIAVAGLYLAACIALGACLRNT